ncbi:hypothetical protein D3C72_2431520 [compost metagenome]
MEAGTGCGLWNINQRLKSRFGREAGITLESSEELGGLKVVLRWRSEEENRRDPIAVGG